jgi:anti-anti-sigma factor
MADPTFTFEVADLTHATVFRLRGAFDLAAGNVFDESIVPLFDGKPTVVVDLSGLTSFEPTGLFCLLNARDQLIDRGASLRVVGGDGILEDWVKVAALFETEEPSEQAAHRHVAEVARKGQDSASSPPARAIRRLLHRRSRG